MKYEHKEQFEKINVFGTGTAAVISPVGRLRYQQEVMTIGGGIADR